MVALQIAELIAADRIAERQRHARAARLVAIARCCPPGTWARTARRVTQAADWLRGALGRDRPGAAPCCAAA